MIKLVSIRGKIWFSLIRIFLKKLDTLFDFDKLNNQKLGSSFPRWKKATFVEFSEFKIDDLKVLKLKNINNNNKKTLLYLHGGAYVACGPETHGPLITRLSEYSQCDVYFPIYGLAPKNPFPCAINDALNTYKYLIDKEVSADKIFIAGDSAGGGLTLALLQKIREEKLELPACVSLISPWTDLTLSGKSTKDRAERDPMIKLDSNFDKIIEAYVGNDSTKNPLISPIFADLSGFPPTQIQVASEEAIYDDSTRLVERYKEFGNEKVEFLEWKGLFHVFQAFCMGFLAIPEAKKSLREIAKFSEKYIN